MFSFIFTYGWKSKVGRCHLNYAVLNRLTTSQRNGSPAPLRVWEDTHHPPHVSPATRAKTLRPPSQLYTTGENPLVQPVELAPLPEVSRRFVSHGTILPPTSTACTTRRARLPRPTSSGHVLSCDVLRPRRHHLHLRLGGVHRLRAKR